MAFRRWLVANDGMVYWVGILAGIAGAIIGWLMAWLSAKAKNAAAQGQIEAQRQSSLFIEQQLAEVQKQRAEWQASSAVARELAAGLTATLEAERKTSAEKLALLEDAQTKLAQTFEALASRSLRQNNESFIQLAQQSLSKHQEAARQELDLRAQKIGEVVKPVQESLAKVDAHMLEIEKTRAGAYASLETHVKSLLEAQVTLRTETASLTRALRSPTVRGRWGELQLRRVVELAGMLAYCDFFEQQSLPGADKEARQRPDLIVKLPGGKCVVVDAKVPLEAYLSAIEATDDETRARKLNEHAAAVRTQFNALARKAYWDGLPNSPEFVVLFLPGESFYSAALQADPSLLEASMQERVIIATPTTLIALLKSVAAGWRAESLAENAKEIADLGRELAKRLEKLLEYWGKVGKALTGGVTAYNDALASYDARVLPSLRRFIDIQKIEFKQGELVQIPNIPRSLPSTESAQNTPLNQLDAERPAD